jgi:hypothetical protein
MSRRHLALEFFRRMRFRCVLCDSDYHPIFAWQIFQKKLTVPICFGCQTKYGTPGCDSITPVVEKKLMEYFAAEQAFWHPGEKIDVEPQIEVKEVPDGQ